MSGNEGGERFVVDFSGLIMAQTLLLVLYHTKETQRQPKLAPAQLSMLA
jgi:hypothetical protein